MPVSGLVVVLGSGLVHCNAQKASPSSDGSPPGDGDAGGITSADAAASSADANTTEASQPDGAAVDPSSADAGGGIEGGGTCNNSLDCPKSQVCNALGRCVECVAQADCASGQSCVGFVCRNACASDKECVGSGLLCDQAQGRCVECVTTRDCTGGRVCNLGVCVSAGSDAGADAAVRDGAPEVDGANEWDAGGGSPPPEFPVPAYCGNAVVDQGEQCDDGNHDTGDGCSPYCRAEPDCSQGRCTSRCGDGIVLPSIGEACDDGNQQPGDGCSETCQIEAGFTCSQPSLGDWQAIPIVYRDFRFGGDFEEMVATGESDPIAGLVSSTLDNRGKPVFAGVADAGAITSADSFAQWYRDTSGVNTAFVSRLVLWSAGDGTYANRWGAGGERWVSYTDGEWCAESALGCSTAPECQSVNGSVCVPCSVAWESAASADSSCTAMPTVHDGTPAFFPLDHAPGMITPSSEFSTAQIPPPYASSWPAEPGKEMHNFSFTSELRYWFTFVAARGDKIDFMGDDDAWVFINRRLAVDLGGTHIPARGTITLTADGNGEVVIPTTTTATQTVSLGLQDGQVYEIAVFHAERKTTSSTYALRVPGFNLAPSQCHR